jgi:hypothetical protein
MIGLPISALADRRGLTMQALDEPLGIDPKLRQHTGVLIGVDLLAQLTVGALSGLGVTAGA